MKISGLGDLDRYSRTILKWISEQQYVNIRATLKVASCSIEFVTSWINRNFPHKLSTNEMVS